MFVFSSRTWPAGSGSFPQSLPTPALDRHDTAAVWAPRLHGEPGGPLSNLAGPPKGLEKVCGVPAGTVVLTVDVLGLALLGPALRSPR
jgi:hypothetical protein